MHSILRSVNILLFKGGSPHINFNQLVEMKILALSGKKAKNNRLVLEHIAKNGPLLKYDIFKNLKTTGLDRYSTVHRRVDNLVKNGYLEESGKRVTKRGKQEEESMYGLTWRGFIASITIKEVRKNITQVLKRNPLLAFPEKEFILQIFSELVIPEELEIIVRSILEVYLKTIPSLELVKNESMSLLAWFLSIKEKPEFPEGFRLSKFPKDLTELLQLLDKPAILKAVKNRLVPLIKQKTMEIEVIYRLLSVFDEFGDFISALEVEDQPSKRVKEYIETELRSSLSDPDLKKMLEGD